MSDLLGADIDRGHLSFATLNLDVGASLRDLQDAMGYASSLTTYRVNRSPCNLDRSPGYLLAGYIGR